MATGLAPSVKVIERSVAAVAAGSDLTTVIGPVPFDGTITAVEYIPTTTITGANTDSRTVALKNAGQAGSGTTQAASLALTSGVNATGKDSKAITVSSTASDVDVAAGDVLYWTSTHVGSTGLADTGGLVRVTVSRDV